MLSRTLAGMLAALLLAACGGGSSEKSSSGGASSASNSSTSSSGSDAGSAGQSVNVAADPGGALKFTTSKIEVASGKVTFDFTNKASIPHAFEIEGHGVEAKTSTVTGGKSSVTVKDLKPGTYEFYCPVPGHKEAGMKGTLTVK
jgi:uncharacterized cupredoxin-like copper-binding protein